MWAPMPADRRADDACVPVRGNHDAQPAAFEVEFGGIAASGEARPGKHDVGFGALPLDTWLRLMLNGR
jgi:hypothetical protein